MTCGFCGGPLPCLTHSQFPKGSKMNAMRHTISGSDAADDDDIPQCPRCGALVADPCQTDEKAQACELPDFCFPNGRLVNGRSEIVANLRAFASNPIYPTLKSEQQKLMTAAADEIERLCRALRDVMNASNDPYEVAQVALALPRPHLSTPEK